MLAAAALLGSVACGLHILLNNSGALAGCERCRCIDCWVRSEFRRPLQRHHPARRRAPTRVSLHRPNPALPRADYAAAALIDRRWYGRVRMQAAGFAALLLLYLLCGALFDRLEANSAAFQVRLARLGGWDASAVPSGSTAWRPTAPHSKWANILVSKV